MPNINDNTIPDETLVENLEEDFKPETKEEPKEENTEKVPYHQDPNVQLYIERQVAKRVGEGDKAWEERLQRLEDRITQPKQQEQPIKIGDWEPANTADAKAAKAIIQQAKQEMLEDLRTQDQQAREAQALKKKEF